MKPWFWCFVSPLSRWIALAGVVALGLALQACDPQRIAELEEGVATEAEVRAKFGEPEAIWDGPNGSKVLEYNRQPEGHKNYQISIGADGKMSALRQLLTPENFAKVQPGMPMEAVRKLLGKPAEVKPYALSQETHMNWRFMEAGTHQSKIFSAVLDNNMQVLRTEIGVDTKASDFKGG